MVRESWQNNPLPQGHFPIKREDTIVFDSVSRMSRNATEGFKDYKTLYEAGINGNHTSRQEFFKT